MCDFVPGINSYELVVEIADLGTYRGPKTGTVSLTISIVDANSDPVFEQSRYNVTMEECVANHTYILRPNVTDVDREANKRSVKTTATLDTAIITQEPGPYQRFSPDRLGKRTWGPIGPHATEAYSVGKFLVVPCNWLLTLSNLLDLAD